MKKPMKVLNFTTDYEDSRERLAHVYDPKTNLIVPAAAGTLIAGASAKSLYNGRISRRNALIGIGGLAALLAGCNPKSDDSPTPAPEPLFNLGEMRVNGTPVAQHQNVNLNTNLRYSSSVLLYPIKQLDNVAVDQLMFDKDGNYDSHLRFGPISFSPSTAVNLGYQFPFRLRPSADTAQLAYALVRNPGTANESTEFILGPDGKELDVNLTALAVAAQYGGLHKVQEADDRMADRYNGSMKVQKNANPGAAVVYANSPSPEEGTAAQNLRTAWQTRMRQYESNAVVDLVQENQKAGKNLRMYVGTPGSVQDIGNLATALGIQQVTKPMVLSIEQADGSYGLVATGSNAQEAALASEVLHNPTGYNLKTSSKYEVSGTSGNLTVTPV